MIYLDTNIFIGSIEGIVSCRKKIETLFVSNNLFCTSELTLAEVLVKPFKYGDTSLIQLYQDFISEKYVEKVVPVTLAILVESAQIRAKTCNKIPDCIHLATAILSGCTKLITSDLDFPLDDRIEIQFFTEASGTI
jgi:predicted nucleic acid-binding protein